MASGRRPKAAATAHSGPSFRKTPYALVATAWQPTTLLVIRYGIQLLARSGPRLSSINAVKGVHNIKIGAAYAQTFLTESDRFGIVNPELLPNCPSGFADQCVTLVPYGLTIGGQLYHYRGYTDIKELAFYAQDTVHKGRWALNFGLRGDLTADQEFEAGLSCNGVAATPTRALPLSARRLSLVPL
jgi:hypothetical protein